MCKLVPIWWTSQCGIYIVHNPLLWNALVWHFRVIKLYQREWWVNASHDSTKNNAIIKARSTTKPRAHRGLLRKRPSLLKMVFQYFPNEDWTYHVWTRRGIWRSIFEHNKVRLVEKIWSHKRLCRPSITLISSPKRVCFNTLRPRQNGRHFADDILKCIFCMKMYEFRLKFHWSLFLRVQLTILQHWLR